MTHLIRRFRNHPTSDLQQRINQLFDIDWYGNGSQRSELTMSDWIPAIDIAETDKEYQVHAIVPNVLNENINITLKDNILTIEGKTEEKHEEKDKNYIHSEIKRGSFSRSITLPDSVDDENIVATCKDGVLNITIPKSNHSRSRQIKVQS